MIEGALHGYSGVRKRFELKPRDSWLALTLLALTVGGCSGMSSSAKAPPPADPNVLPKNYKQDVADFMRLYLNNPVKIRDAYISEPMLKPVGTSTHFVSCIRYNPRDSEGRYEGNTERVALFLGGRLNQFLPANPELCRGAAYQRFPEAEVLVP
jgi:hypothetical protein